MKLKKLTSFLLTALLLFFNSTPALAVAFNDLQTDYWAYKEIQSLTERGVIAGYPDETFKPENTVNRAEFTKMVIKTLDKDTMSITTENIFTDISPDFWAFEDILRSKELGLVVGYPDSTFRPYNTITKSEATSIIAKTVKNCEKCIDCADYREPCVLKMFDDHETVAAWAKKSFKKTIKHELYVNHPDVNYLTPDKELTRAETAVLLYKLRENPSILKAEFQGPEIQQEVENIVIVNNNEPEKLVVEEYSTVIEHLPYTPYTGSVTEVEVQGASANILTYNVLPVRFENGFKSKKVKAGQEVFLTFTKNIKTQEGTKLIPAGSKLVAQISHLKNPKLFQKNAKVTFDITNLVLPNDEVYPISAIIQNYELFDKKFTKCNVAKFGVVGGVIAGFGTLIGLIIGASIDDLSEGTSLGAIIGGGTGALIGLMVPGCSIKISEDEDIYVILQKDLQLELE